MNKIDFKLKGKCEGFINLENPYIIKQSQKKFYYSNEYIPVNILAVPIEKSSELLSGNIGKYAEKDNTEISIEIKESMPSYSVDSEPLLL